jgi:choline dehydrogenase-like flavoprotein
MLIFLDQLPERSLEAEVCVVGAGPAGLTLAMELAANDVSVVLCEAGGLEASAESQSCYEGETIGDDYHYLDAARLRFLGGTSNHWSGVCADLVAADLAEKPFAPQTGWPIGMTEFRPYITRARDILGLPPTLAPQPVLNGLFARLDVKRTSRLRFKDLYLEDLIASEHVTTVLHANLTRLEHESGQVTKMHFQSYSDQAMTVSARHFVIACGGIENARLLMHLNETAGTSFGGTSGALGAYFTEHPHGKVGDYVLFDGAAFNVPGYGSDMSLGVVHMAATDTFLAQGKSLNVRLKFGRYRRDDTRQIVKDLICRAPKLGERLMSDSVCAGNVGMVLEQTPVKENRVALGAERDRFGIRRPVLHWRWVEQDYRTVREVAMAFARQMVEADVGRMSLSDWVLDPSREVEFDEDITAYHHIGTTRMARSAETGVVDTDCRVFGSDNLFLTGSSVFPSAGHANPTAPIMALSLRLADHIAARVR